MLPARQNGSLLPRLLFPYAPTKAAWKGEFSCVECRQPGLSISISRHKVVLRQVHALHEKRPISFRGASYAMNLCNESVRRKPGRCDLWYQRMRQTPRGCKPWGQAERCILRNVTFEMNPWNATDEMHPRGCVFRSFRLLCWQRFPAVQQYAWIRVVR